MNFQDISNISESIFWMAEKSGAALVTIHPDNKCLLNTHSMLLFNTDKNSTTLDDISQSIDNFDSFKSYLEHIYERPDPFELILKSSFKTITINISGFKNRNNKIIYLLLQKQINELISQEYLINFAKNSENAFCIWNTDNKILFHNNKIEALFEHSVQFGSNIYEEIFNRIIPEDYAILSQQLEALKTNPTTTIDLETRYISTKGENKWINFQIIALCDTSEFPCKTLGIFKDITKCKQQTQQLEMSRSTLDHNLIPIYWINKNGKIVYANLSASEKLGYSQEELLECHAKQINPRLASHWEKLWEEIRSTKAISRESILKHKNGHEIPVEIVSSYLEIDNQELVFSYIIDIQEKKAFEEKIVYKQRFEHLLLEISKRFINIPYNQINEAINYTLEEICEFTNSGSAHVYKYDFKNKIIRLQNYYSVHQTEKFNLPSHLDNLPIVDYHFKDLTENRLVLIESTRELPDSYPLKQFFFRNKIGSLVDIGLSYQNSIYGFFGIHDQRYNREWDVDEIQLLHVIGDLFMNALQRASSMKNLLESEQNYRTIFNATGDAIIIIDPDTSIIEDVNQAMLQMWECNYEEALSFTFKDIISTDNQDSSNPIGFIQSAPTKQQTFEWLAKKTNGDQFWVEAVLKGTEINSQQKVIAVFRDISERMLTQNKLKESESRYRMIIEGQSELIIQINKKREILFASPTFESVFKKGSAPIIGQNFMDFVIEEDKDIVSNALSNLKNSPHSCYFELQLLMRDYRKWFAWNFTQVDNSDESEFIGVGRDITYQKLVENALRESEDRFRSIVQNLSDVVFLLDEKANISYVTPSCEKYLGIEIEELLGNNILNFVHTDDKWLAAENIKLHIEGSDYSLPYELRFRHNKDDWKVFEARSQNLLDNEAVNSIIFTISDITDRKLMEKQVLNAIINTEEKERERFAKDLHDDLGPLLSSIKMYVGMLEKVDKEEKQKYIVNNLKEIVKEAITTTKDVSNDLNPHVLNNYGLASALTLFIEKLLEKINISFDDELGKARYAATIELSLYRITKELINNTLKHASANKILLKLWEKDNNLCLQYEDDGMGLPEDALEIKKPSGMGLSNIISRAKSLNAKYTFYTKTEKGFKFEMQVPLLQD